MTTTTARLAAALLLLGACGKGSSASTEAEETGNAAADVLASFDETGTGGGFAYFQRREDLRRGTILDRAMEAVLPSAEAAACWTSVFSECGAGKRVREYQACALGGMSLSGTVTLTFSKQNCTLLQADDSVTRDANFILTGRLNATLTVSSPGGGQKVTRTAGGWTYEVGGLSRVMETGSGTKLFDVSSKTLEPLVGTGYSRQNRVLKSGKLEIKHNLAGYTTTLSPENVTWNGTCNCPVSGKLSGSVTSSSGTENATVEITGCGTGTVTMGAETSSVSFDRCARL